VNERLPNGQPFAAPPVVLSLIRAAMPLAERSDHLFNPALGKLQALWGFHSEPPDCKPPPPAKQIERLVKANPRLSDLALSDIRIKSNNALVQLDFGPFAKALAMDLVIGRLRAEGVRNALINAGGDVRAIGSRTGQPWRVPIRRGTGHGVLAMIEIRGDESLFTVAGHQRNFVYEGKTYHYLIDPRSGAPAEGTQSVTVMHQEAATAAAAAIALFIAGPEGWHGVAQRMGIHQVLLVDHLGTPHLSPAMAERLQLLDKGAPIELSAPLTAPRPAP
jgi:thiamine biosynthesis lipoprotein